MPYKRNLKKRWFVDATIGKNVPFIGGSGVKFGTTPPPSKKTRKAVRKIVKRELQNNQEIKRYVNTISSGATLTHNTLYTMSPLQALAVGNSDTTRLGTSIFVRALKFRFNFQADYSRAFTKLRCMVLWSDNKYIAPPTTMSSGIGTSQLFIPNSFGNEVIYGLVNLKDSGIHQVLCDKTFTLELDANNTTSTNSISRDMTCWINKKVSYDQTGYLKDKQLYVVVIPYVGGGTNGTTVFPYFEMTSLVTYTDG